MSIDTTKESAAHVEVHEDGAEFDKNGEQFNGNVTLTSGDKVYLIPTPSLDPRDPLNMAQWQKTVLLLCMCIYGTISLSMVGGLGGLLGFFIPKYVAEGHDFQDITNLMTYPTLFMGIGNLIGMPLALSIGRRPVFLGSTALLLVAGILCTTQKSYDAHLAARMVLGLAAGQAEALCPLMIQEVQFLHERGRYVMYYTALTNCLVAGYSMCGSYIGDAVGPAGWYGIGTGFAGLIFIVSVFCVPETRYARPLDAYQGRATIVSHFVAAANEEQTYTAQPYTTDDVRTLDTVNYAPKTLRSDLRLIVGKPTWGQGARAFVMMWTVALFPDIFWAFLLNGLTLGVNIAIGTTYSTVLHSPPYSWENKYVSFTTLGQIVVTLIALPLLGQGSDMLIKYLSRRNNGVHRPEYRLIPLIFPTIVGLLSSLLYGYAAKNPEKFHWFAIVFSFNGYFLVFIAASQVAMIYVMDAYPTQAGPALVVVCAMRGFVSFGTSYGIQPFLAQRGYDGAFLIYTMILLGLSLLGIPVYIWGRSIRHYTERWAVNKKDRETTYG